MSNQGGFIGVLFLASVAGEGFGTLQNIYELYVSLMDNKLCVFGVTHSLYLIQTTQMLII